MHVKERICRIIGEGIIELILRRFYNLKCTYFGNFGSDEVTVYAQALCHSLNGFIYNHYRYAPDLRVS